MRRVLPSVLFGLLLVWTGPALTGAPPQATPEEIFTREVQAVGQAWQFSGIDLPAGYAATLTASGNWKINPLWNKKVRAGGNQEFRGVEGYVKQGANQGCLLIRAGDTIMAFSKDDEVVRITTPGKIYFCTNDLPNENGVSPANDYIAAIPIPAAKDAIGAGFLDNRGKLRVRIAVKKGG